MLKILMNAVQKTGKWISPLTLFRKLFGRVVKLFGMKTVLKCFILANAVTFQDILFLLEPIYKVEHWRAGRLIGVYECHNDITNQGKNDLFDVYFHDGTQTASASWAVGLINSAGFTAVAAGDTPASHAGWTEFTGYSQANRPAWSPGAPASQSITNGTAIQYDITAASGSIHGLFVINENTKSGTTGILWATALFSPAVPVVVGDQLRATYTLSA